MAALAVPVVGLVRSTSGDFLLLFAGLAALALAVGAYALRLPIQPVENAQPQAAE
jgi:hypothetical protein